MNISKINYILIFFCVFNSSLYAANIETNNEVYKQKLTKYYEMTYGDIEVLSQKGDPYAQFVLGIGYLTESKAVGHIATGIKWIEKSAEQGYPLAISLMWTHYFDNNYVTLDYAREVNWIYPNPDKIVKWSKLEAELNNSMNAQLDLALIYQFDDIYGYKDQVKSKMYFDKLAKHLIDIINDPNIDSNSSKLDINYKINAKKILGYMYLTGFGVIKDIVKAKDFLPTNFDVAKFESITNKSTLSEYEKNKIIWGYKDFGLHSSKDLDLKQPTLLR